MNDKNDSLNELYTELYNSLGVEPGLLNKTDIGKNLNKKYRDDLFDAKVYALKCLYNIEKENELEKLTNDTKIDNSSPLYGNLEIAPMLEIKDTLWQIIRKLQIQDGLTTENVIAEFSEYLKRYAKNYHIISY